MAIIGRARIIFTNGAVADLKNIESIKLYHTGTGEKSQHWNFKIDNIGCKDDYIYIINEESEK